jgi:hypothetical protein
VTPALPPVGVPFADPNFCPALRRVSNASDSGGFETQLYSQLQAFSSDNAYLLLADANRYLVRRVSDWSDVVGLDTSSWNAPRWQPALAHTLVHYDDNGDADLTVQYTNVDTQVTTNHYTFPSPYVRIRSNQFFDELSRDGRWTAGMAARSDGVNVIFALDLATRTLGAQLPLPTLYLRLGPRRRLRRRRARPRRSVSHRPGCARRTADPHADAEPHANARGHRHADAHADADPHPHPDPHAHADRHPDRDPDPHPALARLDPSPHAG